MENNEENKFTDIILGIGIFIMIAIMVLGIVLTAINN